MREGCGRWDGRYRRRYTAGRMTEKARLTKEERITAIAEGLREAFAGCTVSADGPMSNDLGFVFKIANGDSRAYQLGNKRKNAAVESTR